MVLCRCESSNAFVVTIFHQRSLARAAACPATHAVDIFESEFFFGRLNFAMVIAHAADPLLGLESPVDIPDKQLDDVGVALFRSFMPHQQLLCNPQQSCEEQIVRLVLYKIKPAPGRLMLI